MDQDRVEQLRQEALAQVEQAQDEKSLEDVRLALLGKKGSLSEIMKQLGSMDPEKRQLIAPALNELKATITTQIQAKKTLFADQALEEQLSREALDVTLPVAFGGRGSIHPISHVMEEIIQIFGEMGFSVKEGPDIETDDYNFTRLNIPAHHPARQMHDTFYLNPQEGEGEGNRKLLRTHTSPVQVRTLLKEQPPVRMITLGRTYRCDSDMTHTPMFHQVEGLVIDKTTHMGHLKGVLEAFCEAFFGVKNLKTRLRPSHFPFTEPSVEMDIGCDRSGKQLKIGQGSDWLEVLGAGMVHPHVLTACGVDPDVYQGFAFGMGIDRLAMLKYGIPDLRSFFDSDIRWLSHYGFSPLNMPNLVKGSLS
jgi:phenylalanyl-tRNA synthetase alpha chain